MIDMPGKRIKIIADGPILDTLKITLDGEGYASGSLQADDTLIVYVSARQNAGSSRSSYPGLLELDRILADPALEFSALTVVSFESREMLLKKHQRCPSVTLLECDEVLPFTQLPSLIKQLPNFALTKLASEVGKPRTWVGWLWRLTASNRSLRIVNASYRHDHKNLIAAVRIYLGALQLGHADLSKAEDVLKSLAALEANAGTPFNTTIKPAELVKALKDHRLIIERIASTNPPPASTSPRHRPNLQLYEKNLDSSTDGQCIPDHYRVLMLDDQHDTRGWQPVLNSIVNDSRSVMYARDWAGTQAFLNAPKNYFDVMLLDCNLGPSNESGLELLASLRAFTQDLPVVMMTAYDNAELALWALRAGCNDFYAKELEDQSDRDSLDYYLRFREVLRRKDWEKKIRELWSQLVAHLPTSDPILKEEESHLRYAFYLLFSQADGTTWWSRGTTGILKDEKAAEEFIYRAVVLTIAASDHIHLPTCRDILARARHPGHSISRENALNVIEEAVTWFNNRAPLGPGPTFGDPRLPEGCRLSHEELVEDENVARTAQQGMRIKFGHLERSRLGAVQLVLGYLADQKGVSEDDLSSLFSEAPEEVDVTLDLLEESYPNKFPAPANDHPPKLILIDDEGDINGWHRALEMVLGYKISWHHSIDDFLGTRTALHLHADAILLDLWLKERPDCKPSPEAGLRALRRLKERDLGLPIIIVSAATDTVNAIKCLRRGALDYVPKWLPKEDGVEKWKKFSKSLLDRIDAATRLGKGNLRSVWRGLMKRLKSASKIETCPSLVTGIKRWRSRPASELDVIGDIRHEFYQYLLPALVLYQSKIMTAVLNGEIPPFDAWRVDKVLRTSKAVDEDIILFAGRAAEFLGWARCCIERRRRVGKAEWKNEEGNYRRWIELASQKAAFVWDERVKVKNPSARGSGWRVNADAVLKKAIEAITEFENGAAADAGKILRRSYVASL
ncbi:MAG: response regulator [Acidobacteriota bacterium]|nr:response regulator [Acidobacteriota bacterium]